MISLWPEAGGGCDGRRELPDSVPDSSAAPRCPCWEPGEYGHLLYASVHSCLWKSIRPRSDSCRHLCGCACLCSLHSVAQKCLYGFNLYCGHDDPSLLKNLAGLIGVLRSFLYIFLGWNGKEHPQMQLVHVPSYSLVIVNFASWSVHALRCPSALLLCCPQAGDGAGHGWGHRLWPEVSLERWKRFRVQSATCVGLSANSIHIA